MAPPIALEDLAPVKEAKIYGISEAFIRKCFCDGRLRRHHLRRQVVRTEGEGGLRRRGRGVGHGQALP